MVLGNFHTEKGLKMKVKVVVFDMDGTLLYTLEDLTDSVNFALEKCNLKKRNINEIREFVGDGVYKLIERAVGDNVEKIGECFEIFKNHYSKNSTNKTRPYNGAQETLKKLKDKGLKLAVLSNKPDFEVKKLSKLFFEDIFDISMGETVDFPKKPNPKSLLSIIKTFGVKEKEIIFIGDSEVDIQTAKNAGINCYSVSWGYKTRDFLVQNGAEIIFDNFSDLYENILTMI